ncbi:unnamed protein product [Rotaria sordida]|uniref:Uncharacterized protein n=1 Tax=Rotaria sordida TaxID=392033 RepID=A0A815BMP8_9BILA|nr:unnamed protein product [Rotaria sordida]CAF1551506.1 unnamed protein product [Rotaria sordida]
MEIEVEEEEEVVHEEEQTDQLQKVEEEEEEEKEEEEAEEEEEEAEEEEKHYNLRTRRKLPVQIEAPKLKPRSRRTVNRAAEVDSTSLVKCETEENQASSSTRTLRSRSQLAVPAVKTRSIYATTTSTTVRSIQYAEIKELIEERINNHHQTEKAARYLCNSEEEVDIIELLTSLDELSAQPKSGKLLKALTERQSTQARFLTARDFEDGSLAWKKLNNKPAVYAVTVCIPRPVYNSMMDDETLRNSRVLQTAFFDKMEPVVHLRGKIAAKTHETKCKPIEGSNNTITNGYELAVAKTHATLSATRIGPDGRSITGYDIIMYYKAIDKNMSAAKPKPKAGASSVSKLKSTTTVTTSKTSNEGASSSKPHPLGSTKSEKHLHTTTPVVKDSAITQSTAPKPSKFYFACRNNDIDTVTSLLPTITLEGINQIEPNGSTALHAAAYYGNKEIVKLLLSKGTQRMIKNVHGYTPYDEAKTGDIKKLFQRVEASGSEPRNRFAGVKGPSYEWIFVKSDPSSYASFNRESLWKCRNDEEFDRLCRGIQQYYINENGPLADVEPIESVRLFIDTAIKNNDPTQVVRAYTAETGFYNRVNTDLAQIPAHWSGTKHERNIA